MMFPLPLLLLSSLMLLLFRLYIVASLLLQASPLLLPSLLCWPRPVVAFISAVVGSYAFAVILAVA
jgi:hypothetical protein